MKNPDQHLLSTDDEGTVDFVIGGMVPTFPFDRRNGTLILKIYNQDGGLQDLPVADTKDNEIFGVWLRRFDRYSGKSLTFNELRLKHRNDEIQNGAMVIYSGDSGKVD